MCFATVFTLLGTLVVTFCSCSPSENILPHHSLSYEIHDPHNEGHKGTYSGYGFEPAVKHPEHGSEHPKYDGVYKGDRSYIGTTKWGFPHYTVRYGQYTHHPNKHGGAASYVNVAQWGFSPEHHGHDGNHGYGGHSHGYKGTDGHGSHGYGGHNHEYKGTDSQGSHGYGGYSHGYKGTDNHSENPNHKGANGYPNLHGNNRYEDGAHKRTDGHSRHSYHSGNGGDHHGAHQGSEGQSQHAQNNGYDGYHHGIYSGHKGYDSHPYYNEHNIDDGNHVAASKWAQSQYAQHHGYY